ncbi:MAG: RNase P subunit p30 family protein [Candidatus Micrarchaeia archaeon]
MRSEFPMPDYYDVGVRFWEDSLESYANKLGFKKICCFSHGGNGVEILGRNPGDLKFRKSGKVVLFSSDKPELLKKACRRDADLLFFPKFLPDVGLIRVAAENKKPFEIPVSLIIGRKGVERGLVISKIGFFIKICEKLSADFVITSGASSKFLMKSPSELIAIGEMLGLSHDKAVSSISVVPEYVLERVG